MEKIKQKLYEKMEDELKNYEQELLKMQPKEIIENAYQYTVKSEFISQIKEKNLDEDEIKSLLREKDLLSQFYEDWRNADAQLGEILSYKMDDTIETINIEDYNRKRKLRDIESR